MAGANFTGCTSSQSVKSENVRDNVRDREWKSDILAMPQAFQPMTVMRVARPEKPSNSIYSLTDLEVQLPEGMEGNLEDRKLEKSTDVQHYLHITSGRFSGEINLTCHLYGTGVYEWPEVRRWCEDFDAFVRRYPTQLALANAAYNSMPGDVEVTNSRQKQADLRTLLMLKCVWAETSATKIELPNLTLFSRKAADIWVADAFDARGQWRAQLAIKLSQDDNDRLPDGSVLFARILYYAKFKDK
jgi:hypothetical protein